jgi:hypothetical protein
MNKTCYLCGEEFEKDQLVELTVIAPWNPLRSNVTFSIGKPIDAYADTLRHHQCPNGDENDYQI